MFVEDCARVHANTGATEATSTGWEGRRGGRAQSSCSTRTHLFFSLDPPSRRRIRCCFLRSNTSRRVAAVPWRRDPRPSPSVASVPASASLGCHSCGPSWAWPWSRAAGTNLGCVGARSTRRTAAPAPRPPLHFAPAPSRPFHCLIRVADRAVGGSAGHTQRVRRSVGRHRARGARRRLDGRRRLGRVRAARGGGEGVARHVTAKG